MKPKISDYLHSTAWAPGEFERLEAEFDRKLDVLARALAPCLLKPLRLFAAERVPMAESALAEFVQAEAFMLGQRVWNGWTIALEESPEAPRRERLERAADHALRRCGFGEEAPRDDIVLALAALGPEILPDSLA